MRAGDLDTCTVEGAEASAMCDAVTLPGDYPTADEVASAAEPPHPAAHRAGSFAEARDAFIRACGVTSL